MRIAFAHTGAAHAPISWMEVVWQWTLDPVFLIPFIIAALYLLGWRSMAAGARRRFGRWRPYCLVAGVVVLALALVSPIDALADRSFTWHMLQHELLTMLGVPLMVVSAPFIPVVRGLPWAVRQHVFIPLARNRLVRSVVLFCIRPLVGFLAFVLAILFWHTPELYDRALHNDGWHYVQHGTFVFAAMLFWWNLITPYPFPAPINFLLRILMLFGSTVANTALGATISFAESPLYGFYEAAGFWSLSILEDQRLGGILMWSMGGMLRLIAATILFVAYASREEAHEPYRRAMAAATP